MKFCTLLICCVLMVQNGMGQKNSKATTQKPPTPNSSNNNQQLGNTQKVPASKSFSSKLYEEVKKSQPQNFVLSPLSLTNALAMASLGAKGETAEEIRRSFQFSSNKHNLINGQSNLTSSLKEMSSGNSSIKFVSADKIYANSGLTIKTQYQKDVTLLGGKIENVDFGNGEEAARNINAWVKNKTEGKIEKIVEASALTGQTSLLVLNSIYFKGSWENSFSESKTKKIPFFINASCSVNVEMMTQTNEFQLADLEEAKAQVILLPYQGGRLSMMIYLPNGKEETSLDSLENWLADKSPFDIQEKFLNVSFIQDVIVSLPKFKIRSSLKLNEPLKNLGLKKMFDSATADFSGIFEGSGRFFVSKVSQETFIEVNEEGTEAAAATGFEVAATSFHHTPEFTADRPFLFQIVDSGTKTVLFTGRVKNPLDSGKSTASAGETEEPPCLKLQPTESTTMKTDTSTTENVDTAGNEANCSCEGIQTSDVEKWLFQFCNLSSSPNSTEDFKHNLTTPMSRLEQLMEGCAARKVETEKSYQELNQTVEKLKSKFKELERQQMKEKEDEISANKSNRTEISTTTPRVGVRTRSQTEQEKLQDKFPSLPPAVASGMYHDNGIQWNYTGASNATCFPFDGKINYAIVARSCAAFYKAKNCTKEEFRMDTTKSSLAQGITIPYEVIKSSKSIGVCS